MKKSLTVALVAIISVIVILALEWIAVCGIFKLVTLCFGWQFKWTTATGIWLILNVISAVCKRTITVKTK